MTTDVPAKEWCPSVKVSVCGGSTVENFMFGASLSQRNSMVHGWSDVITCGVCKNSQTLQVFWGGVCIQR